MSITNYFIILFIAHVNFNARQEAVARIFVAVVWNYFEYSRPKGNFASLSSQIGVSYFLCRSSVISRNEPVRTSTRDKQDICSGYDDKGDVPVGCFVTKGDLMAMGMIHQQLILLQQDGTVWNKDHAEVWIVKYPWQRGFLAFLLLSEIELIIGY